ncbi:Copia protein [Vitis vinifera]|uniref:Copia protein n=1 Tax=Vitis vinifera TaxID=29760 RepID=A0A438H251_VITVI|nr:Copia protein [Vitis vinifera]
MGSSMKKCKWSNPKGFKTLGFMREEADRTLFIRRNDEVFLVAQIYVDDIVFGFTSSECALDFAKEMKSEFEMRIVGELTYFLGFQVKQLKDGIFLSQSKSDIAFSVGEYARYQACPKESHLIALKCIIRYIAGTLELGLWYPFNTHSNVACYTNVDWAGNVDDRKKHISAINISKNPVLHSRTKHIDIRHHFIHDLVENKVVSLEYVPTEGQIADILTKHVDVSKFESLRKSIGLCTVN